MNRHEFDLEFDRVRAEWPKSFGAEKRKVIAQIFQYDSRDLLRKVIDNLLQTSRGAPTPQQIENTARKFRIASRDMAVCQKCYGDTDWCMKLPDGTTYSRLCDCQGGPRHQAEQLRAIGEPRDLVEANQIMTWFADERNHTRIAWRNRKWPS